MTDLRALLGDRYDETIKKAAVACAGGVDDCFEILARWEALPEDERTNEWAWDEGLDGAVEGATHWGNEAHRALAAVLPDLLADAWDEAVASMRYEDGTPVQLVSVVNPYRPETAAGRPEPAPGSTNTHTGREGAMKA